MKRKNVFPEAILRDDLKPGPWTVQNQQQGSVNLVHKTMAVPLVDMPCPCGLNHSEGMRIHEYGHVAFTPLDAYTRAKKEGLDKDLVNGVEDARLRTRLEDAMGEELIPPICAGTVASVLTQDLTQGKFDRLIMNFAGAHGARPLALAAREWVRSIEQHDTALSGIAQVMDTAADVMDELQREGKYAKQSPPVFGDTIIAAKKLQYLVRAMQAVMDAIKAKAEKEAEEEDEDEVIEEDAQILLVGDGQNPGMNLWGQMTIEHVPLDKPARAYPARRWSAREEGVMPSAMHRIATDGRIFKQPAHRQEPLTVLVDCSGSMSWNNADLQALLDKVPATTVALYSGQGGRGKLRIVAEKGKKAEAKYIAPPFGGSNTVDGVALRWLAKHKGKKLWVSDGYVNGYSGTDDQLHRDAAEVVTKHKVMRVEHHQQAMEVVTRKRPFKASSWRDATGYANQHDGKELPRR